MDFRERIIAALVAAQHPELVAQVKAIPWAQLWALLLKLWPVIMPFLHPTPAMLSQEGPKPL